MSAPYVAAARSLIEHGIVGPDHPQHLVQHPLCAVAGQQEQVFTRCCGKTIPLPRPLRDCEIDVEAPLGCCDRPYPMYGDG